MTLSVVSKIDDATKAIVNVSGAENESGTLYSSDKSVSLANVYYEIRGTDEAVGVATLTLGEDTISLDDTEADDDVIADDVDNELEIADSRNPEEIEED